MMAWVRSSAGFQREMEPSSLTKMNRLGWELPLSDTLKKGVLLNTTPVGFPPSLLRAAVGIVTTRGTAVPSWRERGETPGPLSLTQIVPLGETAMPPGVTRFGSTCVATPAMSD